jgi:hypothetical protein
MMPIFFDASVSGSGSIENGTSYAVEIHPVTGRTRAGDREELKPADLQQIATLIRSGKLGWRLL